MEVASTLAYCFTAIITAINRFILHAPGVTFTATDSPVRLVSL